MKVSTQTRYGLRLMIDLAMHGGRHEAISLQKVAKSQGLSEKYLWQIANRLKTAGLINSVPGAGGGYMLARSSRKITLADIVTALEGDCSLVACSPTPAICSRSKACVSRHIWRDLGNKLVGEMRSVTLSNMAARQKAMKKSPLEYVI